MSARRRFGDFLFTSATQLLSKLRGLILVPLMLHRFGAAEYGIWVQIIVATSLVCGISQAGLHNALMRYAPAMPPEERGPIFWTGFSWVLGLSLLAAGVLFELAPVMSRWFVLPVEGVRLLPLLVLLAALLQYVSNYYRAVGRARLYIVFDSLPMICELVAVSAVAIVGGGIREMALGLAALELLLLLAEFVPVAILLPPRAPRWEYSRRMLAYSVPQIPANVSAFILNWGDRYVISSLLGPEAVGIYSAAYTLCSIPAFYIRPLTVQLLPDLSKLWDSGDREGAGRLLRRSMKVFVVLSLPSAAGLGLLGPDILGVLAGKHNPAWSLGLMLSIGIGTTMFGLLWLGLHVLLLEERTSISAVIYMFGAALNMALNFILLPRFGLVGAGIATGLAFTAASIPVLLRARRVVGRILDPWPTVRVGAAALLMAALLRIRPPTNALELVLAMALGALAFFAAVLAFKVFSSDEIALAREVLASFRARSKGKAA